MTRCLIAFCGVLALLSILGCGNKGPLYLPRGDVGTEAVQTGTDN